MITKEWKEMGQQTSLINVEREKNNNNQAYW